MILKTNPYRMKCLVVDDESIAVKGIANYIGKLDFLEVAASCSSASEAAEILRNKEIDLMFLDINMPRLSGLDFLESLDKPPLTIITTAYSEYALDGFRLHVTDYLMKPIAFQRFFQAVSKAREMFLLQSGREETTAPSMYIRQGDSFKRIACMQNYVRLHFEDRVLTIHQTMTSLEEILPREAFFRIHRSFLVNISHIDTISGGRIFMGGKELPVSKQRKDELLRSVVYKNLISK